MAEDPYADPNYNPETGQYYNEETGLWEDPVDEYAYPPPDGAIIDREGRLLAAPPVNEKWLVEDYNTFVSSWNKPWMASLSDGKAASKYVWPDIDDCVMLTRVDCFELENPRCQQATTGECLLSLMLTVRCCL